MRVAEVNKLLREDGVAEVIGFEVDERQHAANLGAQPVHGLCFVARGAQDTGLPTGSVDGDIVKLFQDERAVRAAAYAAIERAPARGKLAWEKQYVFDMPLHLRDFEDFVNKIVHARALSAAFAPARARP